MKIPRQFIDDLLVRIDIVDLINSHHPLKKMGANYKACCPFHNEKTPSFSVNRERQIFHCFGCGKSGNAIDFLIEKNNLTFPEAIEDLATFVGLEIPYEVDNQIINTQKTDYSSLYLLMEKMVVLYQQCLLATQKAVNYLHQRGIDAACLQRFSIGYAPNEWHFLEKNHCDTQQLITLGMLSNKEHKFYDRFRDRIMFPIRDKRGRVIAFGGRVLDNSQPKYLNSPETVLFSKGKTVYGLYELLKIDSKPKYIVVVEGYMDVVMLSQYGIYNVVAVLGTALSKAHCDLLFRFTSEIIFCFDGDKAGQEAAWKAVDAAFSAMKDGRQIRFLQLPASHDPDTFVRQQGTEIFQQQLKNADSLSHYFFKQLTSNLNLEELEARSILATKAKPYLDKLSDGFFKSMMLEKLTELTTLKFLNQETTIKVEKKTPLKLSLSRKVIAFLVHSPHLIEVFLKNQIDLATLKFKGYESFKNIIEHIILLKPKNQGMLLAHFRGHSEEKIVNALSQIELLPQEADINAEFEVLLQKWKEERQREQWNKLLEIEKNRGLTPQEKEILRQLSALKF